MRMFLLDRMKFYFRLIRCNVNQIGADSQSYFNALSIILITIIHVHDNTKYYFDFPRRLIIAKKSTCFLIWL